ncbi:MAG: hypothetical protein ACE5G2_11895, partial [Candidatus Krumholzibacteriia bacterium]
LPGPVISVAFYLWAGAYGLILISHFGVLMNESIDAQVAKRLLGLIGSGGILGGMVGGGLATLLAPLVGTERLLAVAGVMLILSAPLAIRVGRTTLQAPPAPAPEAARRRGILDDGYVRVMAGMFLVAGLTAGILDYQFKVILDIHTDSREEISRFLGFYYAGLNLVAILVQVFLTGPVLRRFGASTASSILPLGVMLGAMTAVMLPGAPLLIAATRLYEAMLRLSLTRSSWEFLFFPLSPEIRRRARTFTEAVVDRSAEALAGVLILGLNFLLGGTPLQLAICTLILAIAWWVCNERLNRAYVQQLSVSLREQIVPADRGIETLREARLIEEAHKLLRSPYEMHALSAFELLESLDPAGLNGRLEELLQHPVPAIRARTISKLSDQDEALARPHLDRLIEDDSIEVRAEAIRFHCSQHQDQEAEFERMLHSEDPIIRGAAILCAATHAPAHREDELGEILDHFIREGTVEDRRNVALALGRHTPSGPLHQRMGRLLEDADLEVRRQAILATGHAALREFVPNLITFLENRALREQARAALALYGDRVTGTLGDYLVDTGVPLATRREIPLVFARVATQAAADQLLRVPLPSDPVLLLRLLQAQNKIRSGNKSIMFPRAAVRDSLLRDVGSYLRFLMHTQVWTTQEPSRGRDLVYHTLLERRAAARERIFDRLRLVYPSGEVLLAYRAYADPDRRTHAQALEYLEAFLLPEDRRLVLGVLDDQQENRRRALAESLFGLSPFTLDSSIEDLLAQPDPWLQSCALYWIGTRRFSRMAASIRRLESRHSLVRETAAWSLQRLEAS